MLTGEFRRAVAICGGEDISLSVVDAVYTIFDVDGDGHLSTEEFISIMKSRLKRGLRVSIIRSIFSIICVSCLIIKLGIVSCLIINLGIISLFDNKTGNCQLLALYGLLLCS